MGGQLASRVVQCATMGHLDNATHAARYVVLVMSTIARDKPQRNIDAGIYYGGWRLLARALGYKEDTPAAERAVARAVRELVDLGLIEPLGFGRPGHRQGYRITLPDPLDNVRQE